MTAYLFIIIPVALYLPLFIYETYVSFRRINKTGKRGGAYLNATWEVTHTFLIIGLTNFIWLFSDIAKEVSQAVYWGLMIFGLFFLIRAILYIRLFVVKPNPSKTLDVLFAASHIGMLAGLLYTVAGAAVVLAGNNYTVNTEFIPWMIPGLILMLALGLVPALSIYKTKD